MSLKNFKIVSFACSITYKISGSAEFSSSSTIFNACRRGCEAMMRGDKNCGRVVRNGHVARQLITRRHVFLVVLNRRTISYSFLALQNASNKTTSFCCCQTHRQQPCGTWGRLNSSPTDVGRKWCTQYRPGPGGRKYFD